MVYNVTILTQQCKTKTETEGYLESRLVCVLLQSVLPKKVLNNFLAFFFSYCLLSMYLLWMLKEVVVMGA